VLMKGLHKDVNNDFCEYAKELWYKSSVKDENVLLTSMSRICSLDNLICSEWDKPHRKSCPTLRGFLDSGKPKAR